MGKKKFWFLLGMLEALILLLFSLKKVYVFICLCWVSRFVLSFEERLIGCVDICWELIFWNSVI